MIAGHHSEDYQPIGWVGRVPLYATTILVISYIVTFILGAILIGSGLGGLLGEFTYSSVGVLKNLQIWQVVTYPFVNSPDPIGSLFFAIEMVLLYVFGREVERFLGRRAFVLLYAVLLLAPPVFLTLLSLVNIPSLPAQLAGSSALNFGVFIAFAVIYPEAQIFFSLKAKWIAVALLAIYTVSSFAAHQWVIMGVVWLECVCAVVVLRMRGVTNASFERWLPERERVIPEPRRVKRKRPAARRVEHEETNLYESIDPLLEKISRHGIGSLTRAERSRLEKARDALIEQDKQSS